MSDNLQTLRDDLDYMKALAREGRQTPLVGGSILMLAGVCYGAASFALYLMMKGYVVGSQAIANGVWGAASAAFILGMIVAGRRNRRRPGATSTTNRAVTAGWRGVGWGIFAFIAALAAAAWRLQDQNLVWLIAPFVLVVYGAAWTVASAMSGRRWMGLLAAGCYAGGVVTGVMAGRDEMMLVYAIALQVLATIPGLVLMRGEPSDVI